MPNNKEYPYKRITHFCEKLNQFQGKYPIDIPKYVYDEIDVELKKNGITTKKQYAKITYIQIRNILKDIGRSRYYEHATHIIAKISKKPPPTLSRKNKEKFKRMFAQVEPLFKKHKPPNKTNFLSYSYIMYKFAELLKLTEFKKHLTLLKNKEKLREQDRIWEKICKDLEWEFIPSVEKFIPGSDLYILYHLFNYHKKF